MRVIRPIQGLIETAPVTEIVVDDVGAINMDNGLVDITWTRNQELADSPAAVPVSQLHMIVPVSCMPQIVSKLIMCFLQTQQSEAPKGFSPQLVK